MSGQLVRNQPPSEETLWGYTVQLACALRAVHAAGLAVRAACLNPSKVRDMQACLEAYLYSCPPSWPDAGEQSAILV